MKRPLVNSLLAFVAVSIVASFVASTASARGLIYNQNQRFDDPTLEVPATCDVCVDVYRVHRPIMPGVNHVFVGTQLHTSCEGIERSSLQIFGAVKSSDLGYLQRFIQENRTKQMRHIGRACGQSARDAYAEFSRFSRAWRAWSRQPQNGIPRFIATPILGRPCAVAADKLVKKFTESYMD